MAEPDNIILEHLKAFGGNISSPRADIGKLDGKVDDLSTGQQSMQGVLMAVCHSPYVLDHRVESLEEKIGSQK